MPPKSPVKAQRSLLGWGAPRHAQGDARAREARRAGLVAASRPEGAASFASSSDGPFTLAFYKELLDQVHGADLVCTLTVSSGGDERVFFFTRGAILMVALGASGG